MSWLQEQVGNDWYEVIEPIVKTEDFKQKWQALGKRMKTHTVYPEKDNIFRCFRETPLNNMKVVLIGQDPYHNGTATGLCFDTNGIGTQSLNQIYAGYTKEYPHNFNTNMMSGKLEHWANQGILMLNTALTVDKGNAGSHIAIWENFMKKLFKYFNTIDRPIAYIAWGNKAIEFCKNLNNPKHEIFTAKHPASAVYTKGTWDSNGTFKNVEKWIKEKYEKEIHW